MRMVRMGFSFILILILIKGGGGERKGSRTPVNIHIPLISIKYES